MDRLSLLLIVAVLGITTMAGLARREQVVAAVLRFFNEPGSAFNLAILRVTFFGFQLGTLLPPDDTAASFSRLPRGLLVPPQGLGGLFVYLPITPVAVHVSQAIVIPAAALACVGLWTRTACAVFAVSALYYLGVPQLYGKVDHVHHVLWMAALLAAAPSGDVLSLDSVWRAWRRGPTSQVSSAAVGVRYALPIRFVWVMLGLIYFFPGVAKYYASGLDYLRPATLEYFWHDKWWGQLAAGRSSR